MSSNRENLNSYPVPEPIIVFATFPLCVRGDGYDQTDLPIRDQLGTYLLNILLFYLWQISKEASLNGQQLTSLLSIMETSPTLCYPPPLCGRDVHFYDWQEGQQISTLKMRCCYHFIKVRKLKVYFIIILIHIPSTFKPDWSLNVFTFLPHWTLSKFLPFPLSGLSSSHFKCHRNSRFNGWHFG